MCILLLFDRVKTEIMGGQVADLRLDMITGRDERSARISCSSTLLLSERVNERVRVFVSQPFPQT